MVLMPYLASKSRAAPAPPALEGFPAVLTTVAISEVQSRVVAPRSFFGEEDAEEAVGDVAAAVGGFAGFVRDDGEGVGGAEIIEF